MHTFRSASKEKEKGNLLTALLKPLPQQKERAL